MDNKTRNLIESNFDLIELYLEAKEQLVEGYKEQVQIMKKFNGCLAALACIAMSEPDVMDDVTYDLLERLQYEAAESIRDDEDDEFDDADDDWSLWAQEYLH